MKKNILVLFASFLMLHSLTAQQVNRWIGTDHKIKNAQYKTYEKTSIFNDYKKVYVDLPGKILEFYGGVATINFGGEELFFYGDNVNELILQTESETITAPVMKTKGDYYASTDDLIIVDTYSQRSMFTRRPYIRNNVGNARVIYAPRVYNTSVRTRTNHVRGDYERIVFGGDDALGYRLGSRSNRARNRMISRIMPRFRVAVPAYNIFSFKLNNGNQIVVYELKDEDGNYFYKAQHVSYIKYYDEKGNTGVLVDSDCDGNYHGSKDQMIYNVELKNSNLRTARYKGINSLGWTKLEDVRDLNFMDVKINGDEITFVNNNEKYADMKGSGRLRITDLPLDAEIKINGKVFKNRYTVKKLRCQYGRYRIEIAAPGQDLFVRTFEVNETNKLEEISYLHDRF